jgi:hypothetical protein
MVVVLYEVVYSMHQSDMFSRGKGLEFGDRRVR